MFYIFAGAGTTNDGKTARKFFRTPKRSAEITGVNEEIIRRFGNILTAISCGLEIYVENLINMQRPRPKSLFHFIRGLTFHQVYTRY